MKYRANKKQKTSQIFFAFWLVRGHIYEVYRLREVQMMCNVLKVHRQITEDCGKGTCTHGWIIRSCLKISVDERLDLRNVDKCKYFLFLAKLQCRLSDSQWIKEAKEKEEKHCFFN